jgi:23S rRNA (guanosine2251-2'-O)-methyltransferase
VSLANVAVRSVDNPAMSSPKVLFGFHAVGVRLKTAPKSIVEIYYEPTRRDARMRQFLDKVGESGVRLIEADGLRLSKLAGSHGHQGVAARVQEIKQVHSLDELLENLEASNADLPLAKRVQPLILVLDGVTDPHNLGACLRVADGAGAHAVIAPKDHAAGINATVAKVASGAAETVPYFMVTNLARTLNELKERNIWIIGTSDAATHTLYQADLKGPVALVLGAEGDGMRQLTAKTCDQLVSIPMLGAVESLNVSVASGVCLYEAVRQRSLQSTS